MHTVLPNDLIQKPYQFSNSIFQITTKLYKNYPTPYQIDGVINLVYQFPLKSSPLIMDHVFQISYDNFLTISMLQRNFPSFS